MEISLFQKCVFEFLGTMILILMGDGVCAATTLNKSNAKGAGWIVITFGWGFAVMCGVFIAGPFSGAHLNPVVTLGFAASGMFAWNAVIPYIVAQMLGGFVGAVLVYLFYQDHFAASSDNPNGMLGCFCTMPAIEHKSVNLLSEMIATFVLIFVLLAFSVEGNVPSVGIGDLGAFPVTALIVAIGMSLGGATGYAINPARDFSPRLAHAILPIKGKRDSGWGYSWVPIAGPIAGSLIAAALYLIVY